MNTQPSRDDDHESGNRDHENLNADNHNENTPNHDNLDELNPGTLYSDNLEELYPLMFSKLTGEITIGEDQRLSKLLESPEARAIWESFQKTYNDPEKLLRAQSLVSKDDSDEIARLLVNEQQRRRRSSLLTGVVVLCLAIIAAFIWRQRDNTLPADADNNSLLNIAIVENGTADSSVYALAPGLNQLDACGVALYDTTTQSIKIKPNHGYHDKRYILNVPAGLQCNITLPDSSTVLVNAESKLSFPAVFSGSGRIVALSGEAVFSVKGNARRPFFVKLRKSTVEVLGTVFSVNTYDSTDKITLKEGLVAVAVPGVPSQHLFPGQTALAGDKRIDVSANLSLPIQWEDGIYDLKDIPLRQLAPVLKRRFNIRVVFEPGYTEDNYTGVIYPGESLTSFVQILRSVCKNSRFELHNNILYIKK